MSTLETSLTSLANSERPSYRIQSVERACKLLRELERSPHPRATSDVASACGIERTVAHRLLRTLEENGLVHSANGRYAIGSESLALSTAYMDRHPAHGIVLPYAVDLYRRVVADWPRALVVLVPVGDRAIAVDRMWGKDAPLDTILSLSSSFHMKHSAAGRAMLAYMSPLTSDSDKNNQDQIALNERLTEIVDAGGVDFNSSEQRRGIWSIAAAIVTPDGHAVGAISIAGTDIVKHLSRDSDLARELQRTASSIGGLLRGTNIDIYT